MGVGYASSAGFPLTGTWEKFILASLAGLGIFAVPTFLYLSGSFFAYAANKDDFRHNYKIVWVNIKHVALPYIIWSIIFYFEIYLLHDQKFTLSEYIKKLIVGYPFNFIPLLIFYYLISPLIVRIMRYLGWATILLFGIYQLILLNIANPGILGIQFPSWMNVFALPVLVTPLTEWAIYFPLGIVLFRYSDRLKNHVEKGKWALIISLFVFYVIALFDHLKILDAPFVKYLCPILFLLLTTLLRRDHIPAVRQLELLGKKAYSLYLMNLIVLDSVLVAVQSFVPVLFAYYLIILPILFISALFLPLLIIRVLEMLLPRNYSRYIVGL